MYKVNKRSTTIKFENIKTTQEQNEKTAKAISILLGGYNQYGRSIDSLEYQKIVNDFMNIVYEVEQKL